MNESESESESRWNTSRFEQFQILYIRAFKHRRGHLWSWIRFIEIGGISILGGLVWFRIKHIEENIQDFMIFTNPNNHNLSLYTLQNMMDNNYNIIAFSDDMTNAPNTFFDANNILYIPKSNTSETIDEMSKVRTYITSSLRYGWPINKKVCNFICFNLLCL